MLSFSAIMETIMLICFGCSWPINIMKAWKARTARATSVLFYFLIWIGYIAGIIAKIALIKYNATVPWYETVHWYVMFFYVLNTIMVSGGIAIYYRNKAIDNAMEGNV